MRRLFIRVAPLIMIALGAAGFWVFSHGGLGTITAMRAYAESIDHPIAPMQDGRIAQVLVRIGQEVKAGDVLVKMDTTKLELEHRIVLAELEQTRKDLEAQEVIQAAAVARTESHALRATTTQSETKAQLAAAEQQLQRLEKMSQQQLVQARDVEESRMRQAALAASAAVLDAAAKQKQAGLGRVLQQSKTVSDVQRRLAPFREELKIRELAVKSVELALENATIRSRVDGVVSMIVHYAGDVVSAGTEIVRVTNGRPNYIVSWVNERYATRVAPGQIVKLRGLRLWNPSFEGRVVEVSPTVEEVPSRARSAPHIPVWGRRVIIESWPDRRLVLAEALHVMF